MTLEELRLKLVVAEEKIDKRLLTLNKICDKNNLNVSDILKQANNFKHPFNYNHAREEIKLPDSIEDDTIIYDNIFKLKELEEIRDNWQSKYNAKLDEDNEEKVEVIWDFLTEWETKCIEWYKNNAERYFELSESFIDDSKQYELEYEERNVKPDSDDYLVRSKYDRIKRAYLNAYKENYFNEIATLTKDITDIRYKYENNSITGVISYTVDENKLNKIITQEKERKYKDLVKRVEAVVGTITNAENLTIGNQNGELNGYIEGTNGKCSVETISAGGYNIQCFHYRVIIHKI